MKSAEKPQGRTLAPTGTVPHARRWSLAWAVLCLLILGALPASAAASHPLEYEFLESFGPDGTESTQFSNVGPVAFDQQSEIIYAADGGAGELYKFDSEGNPVDWGGTAPYISGNKITGLSLNVLGEGQAAVDSGSHNVYIVSNNSIVAFQENGEPAEFSAGPDAGTNTITGFSFAAGVAVDANGLIYASDRDADLVKIFEPSGEEVTSFSAENPANLAVASTGAVYVNRRVDTGFSSAPGTVLKYVPSPFPVEGATTYTASSEPFSSRPSNTVAVDPATDDVYIAYPVGFPYSPPAIAVFDQNGAPITTFGEPGTPGEVFYTAGIAIDGDTNRVYVGAAPGTLEPAPRVFVFRPKPPPAPAAPGVENIGVDDVTSSSAILTARINPNSVATTYRFEYGLGDCDSSPCASVPLQGVGIGAGHDVVAVSQQITGLQAGSTYHYRVIAENALGTVSRSGTFQTQGSGLDFRLVDRRAWEMVSPPDKHGARILGSLGQGIAQAAADGNGFAYTTYGSIDAYPMGSRVDSTALARRGGFGWTSNDIAPPNERMIPPPAGLKGEYKLFDPNLQEALLEARDGTSLSPEASERTPYLRQNTEPPRYRPLVTGKAGFANVPPGTEFGGTEFEARLPVNVLSATPDLDHVLLGSTVPLSAGAPASGFYLWTDGRLQPVSVLPEEEGGTMIAGATGSSGGSSGYLGSARHAVADDGSRVFWKGQNGPLYVRDTLAEATARIDVKLGGGEAGDPSPVFQGASADGSVVYFSDSSDLTEDSGSEGADLYRCELPHSSPLDGCHSLVNLTATPAGSGESGEALGTVPAFSEDGSRVYFVARGRLDTGDNQFGDTAVAGSPNLYVWQQGEGVRFIATLSEEDDPDWGSPLGNAEFGWAGSLSASSSPSGRYLAFMSERSLTGEANLDRAGNPVERVFRYDLVGDRLDCISCMPTGGMPRGEILGNDFRLREINPEAVWTGDLVAAAVPPRTTVNCCGSISLYAPRSVHDNGRVFFNAVDPLVPADSNGGWDVYQYEAIGGGTCAASAADAATSLSGLGCVSLISSGTAEGSATFLDASVGGDDVFFLSSARLSSTDPDEEADVYDARVDGVAAVPAVRPECLGESCQPPPAVPNDPTPGTATFHGAGDPTVRAGRRCPKGKRAIRRKGRTRCVRRKHRSGRHHHRPGADRNGRVER